MHNGEDMGQQQETETLVVRAMFSRNWGETFEWQTFQSPCTTLEAAVFKHALAIGATTYNTATAQVLSGNVWGTREESGVQESVRAALGHRVPRHGGMLVDQVELKSGRVFRACDGWILEACADGIHISRVASTVYRFGELELFRHAGDYRETPEEIAAVLGLEEDRRLLEAAVEAAVDNVADYDDSPTIVMEAE